ncbi:MAG TPA: molybdopterin-guanine dinucleotide biosynthesis protein MobB [Thermoanaerobaculia bacterium]
MRVQPFAGPSNSGKTTAICNLIRDAVAGGERAGAIKHTHHALNTEDRGDTAKFRAAGADPVVLAGDGEAVVFRGNGTFRIRFDDPRDLLEVFDGDVVFVEGFKSYDWS